MLKYSKNYFDWLLLCLVAAVHAGPAAVPVSPVGPFDLSADENFSPPPKPPRDPVEGELFQGDIQIAGRRIGQAGTARAPWPNGVIPYRFDCSVENIPSAMSATREAMAEWERRTCIRFVKKRPEDKAFLELFRAAGCWATYVGYRKDTKTQISIGNGCDYKHVMVHELGHVIGFWHEQSRTDRNNYISINFANVLPALRYNFDIVKEQTNHFNEAYDYGSIMHYPWNAFAINRRQKTIIPKRNVYGKIPYVKLSDSDAAQTKKMYKCQEIEIGRATDDRKMNTARKTVGSAVTVSRCQDLDVNCRSWAARGYCDLHPDPMLAVCPKSCSNCGACVDYDVYCGAWASYGLCLDPEFVYYMYKKCRKSCRICQPEPTTRPPPVVRTTARPITESTIRKPTKKFTGKRCLDRSKNCPSWEKHGRCKTDRWVKENCLQSCNRVDICDAQPIKPLGECTDIIGIGWPQKIRPKNFYATSTFYPGGRWGARAHNARLYLEDNHSLKEVGAWCARPHDRRDQFLQINLDYERKITAVATQGRDRYFEHVKSYSLSFSSDGRSWNEYKENGKLKIFDGNCDHFTPVINILQDYQVARYIRFHPVKFLGAKCLRVEVYGC